MGNVRSHKLKELLLDIEKHLHQMDFNTFPGLRQLPSLHDYEIPVSWE